MNETAHNDSIDGWAIVELMGHRKIAGKVSEQEIAGSKLLRVDPPNGPTQFYGASAIYCLTPCDEATARRVTDYIDAPTPVEPYMLPAPDRGLREDYDAAGFALDELGVPDTDATGGDLSLRARIRALAALPNAGDEVDDR